MDEQTIFLIAGFISMCALLGTHDVGRADALYRPVWTLSEKGELNLIRLLNVSGIFYLFILAYGFVHLDWWKPIVATLFFSFIYGLAIRPTIGYPACMFFGNILSALSVIFVIVVWLF